MGFSGLSYSAWITPTLAAFMGADAPSGSDVDVREDAVKD
jgi:hypothetical protein